MADTKISALPLLGAGDLDLVNDHMLVVDASTGDAKRIPPGELLRAAAPYLSTAWDFTTGSLLPTVQFTAASTRWRSNSSGVIVSATTDAPRFQYAPVALTPRGLLVEAARTELYTKNTDFTDVSWGKVGCTAFGNVVAGPDGTTSADEIVEGTTSQQSFGQLAASFTSGVTYIHRIRAKAKTRNWIAVYWDPNRFGGTGFSYFDVANGVVGTPSANMTTFIRPAANGFYECIVIGTCVSSGAGNRSFWLANADGGRVYTGDGTSSLYAWGASLQAGSEVTQHIATDAVTVATAADVATITNPSVLTDQCWVIKGRTPIKLPTGSANTIFQVDDGGNNNRRTIYYLNGRMYVVALIGNVAQATLDMGLVANDTDFSLAVRWADSNFAGSINGGAIVTAASGINPQGMTAARLGAVVGGGFPWNSTIRHIETRRTATNTELPLLAA